MNTARAYNSQIEAHKNNLDDNVSFKLLEKYENKSQAENINTLIVNSILLLFITVVAIQLCRGIYINCDRCFTLDSKINQLEQLNNNASYNNKIYQKNYNNYTSPEGMEALARDNLNLVGENEIAILINNS